ncbi:efflux RND transporter permease subunit [Aliamphritea ceti]|uniref:efflux RND transporter permease subunit n=1 Tax=Aliamphritea ceti TaxID=1524258 RepID=UPI0021C41B8C|nr:efflux RND transporter permease subunit [Aliamphritea ceti]
MIHDTDKGWVAWFARNPVAANLMMALILIAGLMTAMNLRVEAFPPLPPNTVTVSVVYESGSAANAEEGLAIKLEEALQGIEGIKKVTSSSDGSGTSVTIERMSGYDLETLYRDVKNRVDSINTLPQNAERAVVSKASYLEDAVSVQIYGDAAPATLQEVARRLRKQLLNNPAIERVNTNGDRTPEITIQVDESRLQALGISIADIAARIQGSSLNERGGELFSPDGTLVIKADQQAYFQTQFEQILIKQTPDGQRITLADLASVSDGYTQTPVLSRYNGLPTIGLDVKMYTTSDIMLISEQVQQEVEAFRPQLPTGIEAVIWNDQSVYIADRLSLLMKNSIVGIGLVMLLLALFLNVRVAFWVGIGLPVIFCGALLLMDARLFNLTLNELTTFGFIIALGIVVDDAVVVGESIYASREKHGATVAATIAGAQRVTIPTVFGVLTTIVAFMALTLVDGEMGKIFSFFAYAAAFCLAFSLLESKLILPAHLAHLKMQSSLNNPLSRGWGRLQGTMSNGLNYFTRKLYRPLIHQVLEYRYVTVIIAISLFVLVIGMVPSGKIKAVFFPDIPSNFITVQLELEEDAGFGLVQQQALMIEQAAIQLNRDLQQQYALDEAPVTHLAIWTDASSATLIAGLSGQTSRPLSTQDIADSWQDRIGTLEAVRKLKFVTSWEGDDDISIEIRSEDNQTLQAASQAVESALQNYEGTSAIQNTLKAGQGQIDLELTSAGEALGLTAQNIAAQIQQAYQGFEVQRFQRGQDDIKVKLRYPDNARRSIDNLSDARIRTSSGQVLPLESVARISSRYVTTNIYRVNRSRVAVISADVNKAIASPQLILDEMDTELFSQLRRDFPGVEIKLGGEAQEEAETRNSLQGAFLIALIAIYALLAIPLKSYLQPLMIMTAIPFGVVGALIGHWLHDIPLSILSLFGILALSGVVVNDSLLLISRYNEQRNAGMPARLAMIQAGCSRMRAIFLTSITTYAGLVPLIFETSEQAQFLIPAAIAMGYGILFATLITLILIPALTMIGEDLKPATTKRKSRELASVTAPAKPQELIS